MAEFDPLLAPGIHTLTLEQLAATAVTAYPMSERRAQLFANLTAWLDELRARGATGRCWLDGSFLTKKDNPGDIDLVIFPEWAVKPSELVQSELAGLLDKASTKAKFGLDIYLVDSSFPNAAQLTSYWRGWFGFCRDGVTAKGIAEVTL